MAYTYLHAISNFWMTSCGPDKERQRARCGPRAIKCPGLIKTKWTIDPFCILASDSPLSESNSKMAFTHHFNLVSLSWVKKLGIKLLMFCRCSAVVQPHSIKHDKNHHNHHTTFSVETTLMRIPLRTLTLHLKQHQS